jgi:RNA polymerase sigma factor (sigma-70 family)
MNHRTSDVPADFEQLVRDPSGRIRRIARRFAADGGVDDLFQEILTRLWRSLPGLRGDAKVESWIYRIALNAAMTHVAETVRTRDLHAAISATSAAIEGVPAGVTDYLSGARSIK